ncbi:hypothetical protein WDW37_06330 [Bdellovibrionota bacterium FG-1]
MALINSDESGQAVIEYILLLSVVVMIYVALVGWMNRFGFMDKMTKPITTDFARAYQYGDPKAQGFDDGTPKRHPRIQGCEECFRVFINPRFK